MGAMQRLLHLVYPPLCVSCGTTVGGADALCGPCWRESPFITGLICDGCGLPLPGVATPDAPAPLCDGCLHAAPPWRMGRAALVYRDTGRRMVLGLKHGARTDLAPAAAYWLRRAGAPFLDRATLLAPVPLHRLRLLRRRYNQSAVLAQALGRLTGCAICPDLLIRTRATPPLDGHGRDARAEILSGAIAVHPRRGALLAGQRLVIVDDVMTSGATLRACTRAALDAGAADVCVLALARVARDA